MGYKTLLILLFSIPFSYFSQWGCTDPQATNYDVNASINDGSCIYSPTNYTLNLINNLSDVLQENSGLIRIGNLLYAFNDSGSGAVIYELDTLGTVLRTIVISGATNVDWEAITSNSTHVFVGDVGNNNGNRHDLCLYRFLKSDLTLDTIQAEKLAFYWSDQTQFTSLPNANNFDCEAIIADADSITLFSKNWEDLQTRRYRLPTYWTDTIAAELIDSFNVDGLITDACTDTIEHRSYLLGYKNNGSNFYTSFVWCLWDYQNQNVFSGNRRRIEVGNVLNLAQTEGIALNASNKGYISSEKVASVITIAPKLFQFNFSQFIEPTASVKPTEPMVPFQLVPNLEEGYTELIIPKPFNQFTLSDIQGRTIHLESSNRLNIYAHGFVVLTLDGKNTLLFLP
ncbi:MAG: hypothetical protein RL365_31 [Bacteroidota bacterium]|jgi:hypothetical protein